MKIKKGTKLLITHFRKGRFKGIALNDFDTNDEFYPIVLNQDYKVGISLDWEQGEKIPCRGKFCTLEEIKEIK